ncbi:uncharacterized protein LOC135223577 [Macrobrachium nipponense]|uniref:uncharacterized protein LOC135223577 n=1 Tax=Macrobrachium nipponense TaxID=159736 RepID=UPI0030C84346
MESIELIVEYAEQREKIYKEFLERLKEWISIRPRTIQGLLDLISYIDSFHKGANVANIVGSAAGIAGAGGVLLAPFTGGLSLAVGGIAASAVGAATSLVASFQDNSVARENCGKAQELIDKDAKATNALTSSMKQYHEMTQKLSDCLRSAHGKINFESLPPIVANSQAASSYLLGTGLVASASAFGKGASKAGARLLPVVSVVCIAIDVWSIVTTTVDMVEGSKSEAGKELLKVVQKLRKQGRKLSIHIIEAIRLKSQDAPCKDNEKQLIWQLLQLYEKEKETESDSSDSDESDDENSINFCLMNARSVFNKWEVIAKYVVQKSTDVLAATETWDRLKPMVTTLLGYYPFFYLPREARRGGGVGALIKSDIKIIDIKCNFKFQTFECINCILLVDSKGRTSSMIDIYILYRPPNLVLGPFPEEFKSLIKGSLSNSKVIIMGDFNVDWKRSETNKYELSKTNKMRDLLCELQLRQHVEEETHKKGRILDWVVTGNLEPYRLSNLRVDRLRDLDHYPVTFTLELKR